MKSNALLALLLALACSPDERPVVGPWYELRLPATWVPTAARTDVQTSIEAAWTQPPSRQVSLVLARPVPFAGTAKEFAATKQPAKVGAPEREEMLGRMSALVVDAARKDAAIRYWFFVREGMAGMLECTAPKLVDLKACDRAASSFRVTGPIPTTSARLISGEPKDLQLAGYKFKVPSGWSQVDSKPIPNATWAMRADKKAGRSFPTVFLTTEKCAVSLDEYAEGGKLQPAHAVIRSRREATLLEQRALQFDTVLPAAESGGRRTLQLETVKDGTAFVLSCVGDPEDFGPAREACELITATLREPPRP